MVGKRRQLVSAPAGVTLAHGKDGGARAVSAAGTDGLVGVRSNTIQGSRGRVASLISGGPAGQEHGVLLGGRGGGGVHHGGEECEEDKSSSHGGHCGLSQH